jgi:hypothetical protein
MHKAVAEESIHSKSFTASKHVLVVVILVLHTSVPVIVWLLAEKEDILFPSKD